MNVYLETSAALRDLLEASDGTAIRRLLARADVVITSQLTLVEVARVWARLSVLEPQVTAGGAQRYAQFQADQERWFVQPVDEGIWARCTRPFPLEPVRLLDAVHLATIEKVAGAVSSLLVVSTDARLGANARELGYALWEG